MAKFLATGPVSSSQYLPFDLGPGASTPASKSATFLNPLSRDPVCIRNRVDARSGYFLSGDVTRSSRVLNRKRQSGNFGRFATHALLPIFPEES